MIRESPDAKPTVPSSAFVSEMAYVVGDVLLGDEVSVWPFACLRGDHQQIVVGEKSNVQDGSVLHAATVGDRVTVGHNVVVDRATIGDDSLVGIGSTVLPGAKVESNCLVAADTTVREGVTVPEGHLVFGSSGESVPLTGEHEEQIQQSWKDYLEFQARFEDAGNLQGAPGGE